MMAASEATKRRRRSGVRPRESREGVGVWTRPEHERFLQAQRLFPKGPWKLVAQFVGTRSTRQTMTHAQKHRQKLQRRHRGLRRSRRDAPPPLPVPVLVPKAPPSPSSEASAGVEDAGIDQPETPVPSPLVEARDPTALLFDGGEVRFQDLLLMPVGADCPPLLSLSAASGWDEPLQALDALCGPKTAPPDDFPGLDDALDYIIQSM